MRDSIDRLGAPGFAVPPTVKVYSSSELEACQASSLPPT